MKPPVAHGIPLDVRLRHPGEALREELEARIISVEALALQTDLPPPYLKAIMTGHMPLQPEDDTVIAKALNIGDGFLLMMQIEHDMQQQKRRLKPPPLSLPAT